MSQAVRAATVVLMGVAGAFLTVGALKEVAAEVIAAFAVLGAFLVNLMLLLATVFNPGRLKAAQIAEVAAELRSQQQRAIALFGAYMAAIVLFLVIKSVGAWASYDGPWQDAALRALTAAAGLITGYCVVGTAGFLVALRSIQTLRHNLLIQEAQAREQEEQRRAMEKVAYMPPPATAGTYGRRHDGRA